MKSVIIWVLVATSASAGVWQRRMQSGKGDAVDAPQAHRLAYFVRDPFLRDDGADFCIDCTPQGKATVHTRHRYRTELKKVGELRGFAIYDLFYRFDDHIDSGKISWKSTLVEISPGKFREIYHLQPREVELNPSFFLLVSSEKLLGTRARIPGTGGFYYEDYWWFSPAGATRIDITLITKAVTSILPSGYSVWKGYGLDMAALRYEMSVGKKGTRTVVHLAVRLM